MADNNYEIAIVEDNPNDAELIMRVLKKHSLANKYVLLKDGAEAMGFFFAQDFACGIDQVVPKIILLDWKLPKVNGAELLQRLKSDERTKAIPVIVLTSSTEQRDFNEAYALGANSYVAKPINFEEFAKTVVEIGRYWLTLNKSCD